MELPDEIWGLIKEYTFDWTIPHKKKMESTLQHIDGLFEEVYSRWTTFPPLQNTNDIIRHEYAGVRRWDWAPRPHLQLTSLTWNINSNNNGGWWAGYGWHRKGETNAYL